ncbi:hypothetical protein [Streptomyces canus]|uniref:hypothetical protein n=1 Tax=Streptomyces canus TaxID=58343 RepID=UPI003CF914B6
MPEQHTVNTEFGPLVVEAWLLNLWNTHGWPEDHVLRDMVAAQGEAPSADA